MASVESVLPALSGRDDSIEFILLGTGTSSTLPHVDCLTAPPGAKPCRSCLASVTPEGRKNKRGNTSAVFRLRGRDGELKTIVIDVGKSFLHSAVEWFPKYGLRQIDAVLLTHAHADAMNGLDDLRGWTLGGAIQSHVDIYCTQDTYEAVQITFPYLVNKKAASGGGDVPEFRWYPIVSDREPFEIGETGIMINPIAVHHGFCGAKPARCPPPLAILPAQFENSSPYASAMPGTPESGSSVSTPESGTGASTPKKEDFICMGFIIQESVVYISDTSNIPDDVMDHITSHKWPSPADSRAKGPPVLILDCLSLASHLSHLSLAQSVEYSRKIDAQKTYLVGFSHSVAHDEYETLLRTVGGREPEPKEITEKVSHGLETLDLTGEKTWIRPAFDGLRIFVSDDGQARDTGYHAEK